MMKWAMLALGVFLVGRSSLSMWQISQLRSHGAQATAQLIITAETHHEFDIVTGRYGQVQHQKVYAAAPAWQFTTATGREIEVPTTVTNQELADRVPRTITYLPESPEVARLADDVAHPFWPWVGLSSGAGLIGLTFALGRRRRS